MQNKRIFNKATSLLLAVMMVVGLFNAMPLMASAADPDFTVSNMSQLTAAIVNAPDGTPVVIQLTQSIDVSTPMTINNKIITFDVGEYGLTFWAGLLTVSNSTIDYIKSGNGYMYSTAGVNITNSTASFMAFSAGGASHTPYLLDNSNVTINEWDIFVQADCYVGLINGSTLTVNGSFEIGEEQNVYAIQCSGGSEVIINGNLKGESTAIHAFNGGKVTVNGSIKESNKIKINNNEMAVTAGVSSVSKPDYIEYSDGNAFVWVKEIYVAPTYYEIYNLDELYDALEEMPDRIPCVVRLMDDIDEESAMYYSFDIMNKYITFELDDHLLAFGSMEIYGSRITFNGDVSPLGQPGIQIELSTVIINGDVITDGANIDGCVLTSSRVSDVTINGNVISGGGGVSANYSGTVTVNGYVTTQWWSTKATYNGKITVNGNVRAYQHTAVVVDEFGGKITVYGNVYGGEGYYSSFPAVWVFNIWYDYFDWGVLAEVYIDGNLHGGITNSGKGKITVIGNVYGDDGGGASPFMMTAFSSNPDPDDALIFVDGSAEDDEDGAEIEIGGDIYAGSGMGVYAVNSAKVTVGGKIFEGVPSYFDETSTVEIKGEEPGEGVCSIGSVSYATFDAALAAVPSGTSGATTEIKLLGNITASDVSITNKKITFDLNGYNLVFTTGGGGYPSISLKLIDSIIDYTGAGSIIAKTGVQYGTAFEIRGGSVALTGIEMRHDNNIAFEAGYADVTINGDIKSYGNISSEGVYLWSGSSFLLNGNILFEEGGWQRIGLLLNNESTATINGDVYVYSDSGYAVGVLCEDNGSKAVINGNITALCPTGYSKGVEVGWGAEVIVTGNVTTDDMGITISEPAGYVTIDGSIDAPRYIAFGTRYEYEIAGETVFFAEGTGKPSADKPGYLEYSDEDWAGCIVWVKGEAHTHDHVKYVTDPTCTEQGFTTYICDCGDEYIDDASYVNALGHDFAVPTGHKDATCEADGYDIFKCVRCDESMTVVLTATGHDYKGVVTAPKCEEQGYTTYTCDNCGDVVVKDYVEALGHAWDDGVVTKEPTEYEDGVKTFTCERCLETRTETISALGHTHSYTTVVTAPTCTEQGYTTHTCICGETYKDTYTAALDHDFTVHVGHKDATCEESGYNVFKCSRCDETKTVILPALSHAWDDGVVTAPTCNNQGFTTYTCANCHESKVEDYTTALGHDFTVLIDHKDATADEDGYDVYKCSRCEETKTVVIPKTGGVRLVSVTTTAKDFISIKETAKNSRIWELTFNVTFTYSDGTKKVLPYTIKLNGNNANQDGKYKFADDHALAGYTLIYDIKGNGSNIKDFRLIQN